MLFPPPPPQKKKKKKITETARLPGANFRFPNHSAMARVLVYGGL